MRFPLTSVRIYGNALLKRWNVKRTNVAFIFSDCWGMGNFTFRSLLLRIKIGTTNNLSVSDLTSTLCLYSILFLFFKVDFLLYLFSSNNILTVRFFCAKSR